MERKGGRTSKISAAMIHRKGLGLFSLLPTEIRFQIWDSLEVYEGLLETSSDMQHEVSTYLYSKITLTFEISGNISDNVSESGLITTTILVYDDDRDINYGSLNPAYFMFDSFDRGRVERYLRLPYWLLRKVVVKLNVIDYTKAEETTASISGSIIYLFNAVTWLIDLFQRAGNVPRILIDWSWYYASWRRRHPDWIFNWPYPDFDSEFTLSHNRSPDVYRVIQLFRRLRNVELEFDPPELIKEYPPWLRLQEKIVACAAIKMPFGESPGDSLIRDEEWMQALVYDKIVREYCQASDKEAAMLIRDQCLYYSKTYDECFNTRLQEVKKHSCQVWTQIGQSFGIDELELTAICKAASEFNGRSNQSFTHFEPPAGGDSLDPSSIFIVHKFAPLIPWPGGFRWGKMRWDNEFEAKPSGVNTDAYRDEMAVWGSLLKEHLGSTCCDPSFKMISRDALSGQFANAHRKLCRVLPGQDLRIQMVPRSVPVIVTSSKGLKHQILPW